MQFELNAAIPILQRTPSVLRSLLEGLEMDWLHQPYGPETWSAHEIVGHLIWGDQTDWMVRLRRILESGEGVSFDSFDRQGHQSLCQARTTEQLLRQFEELRQQNLAELRELKLTVEQLSLSGQHPELGRVTIEQLLATWTVHDLNHIAQVCKALAFQYATAVGPWEAYLSILAAPNPR